MPRLDRGGEPGPRARSSWVPDLRPARFASGPSSGMTILDDVWQFIFPSGEVPEQSGGEGGERSELSSGLRPPAPPSQRHALIHLPEGEDVRARGLCARRGCGFREGRWLVRGGETGWTAAEECVPTSQVLIEWHAPTIRSRTPRIPVQSASLSTDENIHFDLGSSARRIGCAFAVGYPVMARRLDLLCRHCGDFADPSLPEWSARYVRVGE